MSKLIYLDANAHVPMNKQAIKAYCEYHESMDGHGHPLSMTTPGIGASIKLEEARENIANCIGSEEAGNVVFTFNCTQACEWAIKILADNCPVTFISEGEHSAVTMAYRKWIGEPKFITEYVENHDGYKDAGLGCIRVQNETGLIYPDLIHMPSKLLFCDMSQALGKINVDVTGLDIAAFGGHKFGGTNLGFLYFKDPSLCEELNSGSRYFLDAPGTPNVAAAVATSVALMDAIRTLDERTEKMRQFQTTIEDYFQNKNITVVHKDKPRSPNTTFIHLPHAINLIHSLSQKGIFVGLGSACGALHEGLSPFMKYSGYNNSSSQDFMRISQFGEYGIEEAKLFIDQFDKSFEEVFHKPA